MKTLYRIYLIIVGLSFYSCKKYLDAKPDKSLQTPTTIQAIQGILNNYTQMNQLSTLSGEIASDNYFLNDSIFMTLPDDRSRNAYLWDSHIFNGAQPDDWQNEYTIVYDANVVLDYLPSIKRDKLNALEWDKCKGQALLFRAKSFFEIAQVWAKAYDSTTASLDLGIPLRLTSDFNVPTLRSNIQQTYEQIITDLKAAIPLLSDNSEVVFQPTKPAAYGLLARTFLVLGDYKEAGLYADSCLMIRNSLVDYNSLNPDDKYPFSPLQYTNPEDILHSNASSSNPNLKPTLGRIDSTLYDSYSDNDLRKVIYFKENADGTHYFVGSYHASSPSVSYNGVAVDEMLLISAECSARLENGDKAIELLNRLLEKRWKAEKFIPLKAEDAKQALALVLSERRKELVFRSLRFSDIKRLNRIGGKIILKRVINGKVYILEPNDPKYALPIPDNVVQMTGIPQN